MFRRAKNDAAACDRHEIELQGHALAVLVVPCRAEAGPELLFPALCDAKATGMLGPQTSVVPEMKKETTVSSAASATPIR
jgi:hypothetical protein